MFNLLKADLLKLKYSKGKRITVISVIILFLIYLLLGDSSFVYSGQLYPLGNSIGFVSNCYRDVNNPLAGEIIRTAMAYTVFIWIVILIFSASFFTKEYSENTIKLSIAYGESRFKLYLSKAIIIFGYSFLLYYLFTLSIFAHACITLNFIPTISEISLLIKLLTLNFMVIVVFILITLTLIMVFRNTGLVNTIICCFIFSGALTYMAFWEKFNEQSFLIKVFLKVNPIYYWATICSYNLNNNIILQTLTYFAISIVVLALVTYLILKKQEIK